MTDPHGHVDEQFGCWVVSKHLKDGHCSFVYVADGVENHYGDVSTLKIAHMVCNNDVMLRKEAAFLKDLHHPNVVRCYGIGEKGDMVYLILEYIDGEDLEDKLKQDGPFNEADVKEKMLQVIDGLQYLHQHGIAHLDIKISNIMVERDSGRCKIVDFGLSEDVGTDVESRRKVESWRGVLRNNAPETMKKIPYDAIRADVWSVGVLIYECITGERPFRTYLVEDGLLSHVVMEGLLDSTPSLCDPVKDLLKKIFRLSPCERLTLDEIKSHPWFN